MKKRVASCLIFLLILTISSFVQAADIVATVIKEQDVVEAGGKAAFTIILKNNKVRDDTFQLSVDKFSVSPFSTAVERVTFSPSPTVTVKAGQQETVEATIYFLETAKVNQNYITEVAIKSITDAATIAKTALSIYVIPSQEIVNIEVESPSRASPGTQHLVSVSLENKGTEQLSNLNIFYTTPFFNAEDTLSLEPFGTAEKKFTLEVPPLVEPGEYTLTIRLFNGNIIKGSENVNLIIKEQTNVEEGENIQKKFLGYTVEIIRKNNGNTGVEKTVLYPTGTFSNWFTKTEPEGAIKYEGEKKYYQWSINIGPGETYKINITTDYKPIFFTIIIALLLLGIALYLKKRDIRVLKTILKITENKTTDFLDCKVLLHVKNRTENELYNVKVIDIIPRVLKIELDHFGTLKPDKVFEGTAGTRLIWIIKKLDSGDEVVITYRLTSKVSLLGKITLPAAIGQYYGKKKQIVNVKSNKIRYK